MLLALVVWIGGIILFAFVVAPAVFSGILPTRHLAGEIVTRVLGRLHWMAIVCAIVFLLASLGWNAMARGAARPLAIKHLLIIAMLALTLISQFGVSARMERLRVSIGEMDSVAASDPSRMEFNRLHNWSTRIEGTVLVLSLLAIFAVAREASPRLKR